MCGTYESYLRRFAVTEGEATRFTHLDMPQKKFVTNRDSGFLIRKRGSDKVTANDIVNFPSFMRRVVPGLSRILVSHKHVTKHTCIRMCWAWGWLLVLYRVPSQVPGDVQSDWHFPVTIQLGETTGSRE